MFSNYISNISANLQTNKFTILHVYSIFSTHAIFFDEMEPAFVIHNISIATAAEIIHICDDVNVYPVC